MNFFCMLAVVFKKEMHKLDYYLVMLQTAFDFCSIGVYNSLYNFVPVLHHLSAFCSLKLYIDHEFDYDIPEYHGVDLEPGLI